MIFFSCTALLIVVIRKIHMLNYSFSVFFLLLCKWILWKHLDTMASDVRVYKFECVNPYNPSDHNHPNGHIPIEPGDSLEVDSSSIDIANKESPQVSATAGGSLDLNYRLKENLKKILKPWKGILCFHFRFCLSVCERATEYTTVWLHNILIKLDVPSPVFAILLHKTCVWSNFTKIKIRWR